MQNKKRFITIEKIFATLSLVAGVYLCSCAIYLAYVAVALELHGVHTQGQVINVQKKSRAASGIKYYPQITYTDTHGDRVTFLSDIYTYSSATYQVGEKVDVLHLPEGTPHATIRKPASLWNQPIGLFLFGSIFIFIPSIPALLLFRKRKLTDYLAVNGQTIAARVNGVKSYANNSRRYNSTRFMSIEAQWQDPVRKNVYVFTSPMLTYDPTSFLPQTITVRIDPKNPKRYIMDTSFLPQ